MEVKCNKCGWKGYEDNLVPFVDDEGGNNGCPRCETDHYLQDIIEEDIDE